MADKSTLSRAFNNLFVQFLTEMIDIVPQPVSKEIVQAKTYFETIKQMNPALIIKVWYTNIYLPYAEVIEQGDLFTFLINKDYGQDSDIQSFENVSEILKVINKLRQPIREMSEHNKTQSLEYIKKLSILSKHYST